MYSAGTGPSRAPLTREPRWTSIAPWRRISGSWFVSGQRWCSWCSRVHGGAGIGQPLLSGRGRGTGGTTTGSTTGAGGAGGGPCVPVDDYNPCTADVCNAGMPSNPFLEEGTVCGMSQGVELVCDSKVNAWGATSRAIASVPTTSARYARAQHSCAAYRLPRRTRP